MPYIRSNCQGPIATHTKPKLPSFIWTRGLANLIGTLASHGKSISHLKNKPLEEERSPNGLFTPMLHKNMKLFFAIALSLPEFSPPVQA